MNDEKILLSRTDNLGDVILTLPMAGVIKNHFPDCSIYFLGKDYTESIVKRSVNIDNFINIERLDENSLQDIDCLIHVLPVKKIARLGKRQKIPMRIGTSHRMYHWWTCNKLVNLGRKKSDLHESQLNLKLLKPLKIHPDIDLYEMHHFLGWQNSRKTYPELLLDNFNLIFHPKSKGSAKEWPLAQYCKLAQQLNKQTFKIFITGTTAEGELIRKNCPELIDLEHVQDLTGKFSLDELVDFIAASSGLLAASTGPLHIAAASGIYNLGLYADKKPIHAGRWGPIGKKSTILSEIKAVGSDLNIHVNTVRKIIENWIER